MPVNTSSAMDDASDTTQLLMESRQGRKEALDALIPKVHDELRTIAHRLLQKRPATCSVPPRWSTRPT